MAPEQVPSCFIVLGDYNVVKMRVRPWVTTMWLGAWGCSETSPSRSHTCVGLTVPRLRKDCAKQSDPDPEPNTNIPQAFIASNCDEIGTFLEFLPSVERVTRLSHAPLGRPKVDALCLDQSRPRLSL